MDYAVLTVFFYFKTNLAEWEKGLFRQLKWDTAEPTCKIKHSIMD